MNSRKKIIILVATIIALIIILGLVIFSLVKMEKTSEPITSANLKKTEAPVSHLTEAQKVITPEEKKIMGFWEGENVKAFNRGTDGSVVEYEYIGNVGQKDSDKDGLSDEQEQKLGTNPNNPDTDGDGMDDIVELRIGRDPLVKDK